MVRIFLWQKYVNPGLETQNEEKLRAYLMFTNNFCKIIRSVSKEIPMLRIHTKPDRNTQKLAVCFVYIYDIHILGNQKGSHNNQQYSIPTTPVENAQRWMSKNTFQISLLIDDNMIGEH